MINLLTIDAESLLEKELNIGAWDNFLQGLPEKALSLGVRILLAVIGFVVGVWVIKLIRKILKKSLIKFKAEIGVVQFIDSLLKFLLYVVLVLLLASNFGLDAATIVAVLGSAGVAIGLAIQGSLSNLAGGVLILLLKPFKVGDYIVADSGKEGVVKEIQIIYTKLETVDGRLVVLPNGTLANGSIINVSALPNRRIDVDVDIAYSADLKLAKDVLMGVIDSCEYALDGFDKNIFVRGLGNSGVGLTVRLWVKSENYWNALWEVTEQCKLALDKNNIEIPYTQVDVHMK